MSGSVTEPSSWPKWQWTGLIALALPVGAFSVTNATFAMMQSAGLFGGTETPGIAIFRAVCALGIAGFGTLLLARGRYNRAAGLLGVLLVAMTTQVAPMPPLDGQTTPLAVTIFLAIALRSFCIGYFWPLFCLEISGGPSTPGRRRFIHVAALVFAILPVPALWAGIFAARRDISAVIWIVTILGNQFLGYWILASNYRRNDAAGRNRIKIAFVAFLCFLVSSMAATAAIISDAVFLDVIIAALTLTGAAIFGYAVLRQRLFDFSFALNRTLVYGAVSFILLAGFGLAEWAVEHFHLIPEAWHEGGGSIASAGIALALFLSFHRLRDWVERHVERLFFRRWHENESALRRFVACATNYEKSAALCRDFAQELSRFARGAASAVYLRDANGSYVLQAGAIAGAAAAYSPDGDRLFALMRTEREPIELAEIDHAIPAALGLPMLNQGRLFGFALLAEKGDASRYRPDEVNVLGWATLQVGYDLQAINAGDLESEVIKLRDQVAWQAGKGSAPRRRAARAA